MADTPPKPGDRRQQGDGSWVVFSKAEGWRPEAKKSKGAAAPADFDAEKAADSAAKLAPKPPTTPAPATPAPAKTQTLAELMAKTNADRDAAAAARREAMEKEKE